MVKYKKLRHIISLLIAIFVVFGGGMFITLDPIFFMHSEAFGRFIILVIVGFIYVAGITYPGWDYD